MKLDPRPGSAGKPEAKRDSQRAHGAEQKCQMTPIQNPVAKSRGEAADGDVSRR